MWAGFVSTWMSVGIRFIFIFIFFTNSFSARKLFSLCRGHILESKSLWEYNAIFKPVFSFRENQQREHILQPYQAQVSGWHHCHQSHLESLRHQELIESLWALQLQKTSFLMEQRKTWVKDKLWINKSEKKNIPTSKRKETTKKLQSWFTEETVQYKIIRKNKLWKFSCS